MTETEKLLASAVASGLASAAGADAPKFSLTLQDDDITIVLEGHEQVIMASLSAEEWCIELVLGNMEEDSVLHVNLAEGIEEIYESLLEGIRIDKELAAARAKREAEKTDWDRKVEEQKAMYDELLALWMELLPRRHKDNEDDHPFCFYHYDHPTKGRCYVVDLTDAPLSIDIYYNPAAAEWHCQLWHKTNGLTEIVRRFGIKPAMSVALLTTIGYSMGERRAEETGMG